MHRPITIAVLAAAGLWLTSAALAQEPKATPPGPRRGEVRGEQDAPPMPRGPFRGEGRRGPEGRPEPGGPPDGPDGRGPGFGPRGSGFPGGLFGSGMPGMPGQDLRRLQQDDPGMYELLVADNELDRKALQTAERLRRAASDSRDKLQAELKEIVSEHFDARQKRRELQLKRMEEEIQRLRGAIEARNEAREEIVNKRISELSGEVNPLDF